MSESAAIAESAPAEETIEQIGARIFADDAPKAPAEPVAAEPEPAVDPPKDPVAERASARIIANQRAEMRAAKVRAEIAAEKAAVDAERSAVGEDAKLAALVKAAKASPSKAMELLGYAKPKDFLEALASEHEPEAVAKRAVEGTLTEVQQLKADLASLRAERAAEVRALREREADLEAQQAGSGFLDFVASNHEKYPNLIEVMGPKEIVEAGFALLHEVLGKDHKGNDVTRLDAWMADHDGNPPTDDEIADALEERATPRAKARSEWRTRIGKNAPPASTATPSVDVRATQMDRGPSPRTLTSRAASEKAAAAPAWSQEAADEESLRIIRAAFSAG